MDRVSISTIKYHYNSFVSDGIDPLIALNWVMWVYYGFEFRQPLSKILQFNNSKTSKGEKQGYLTGIMYLIPANGSGVNLCPMAAVAACETGCLNTAGRGQMTNVQASRMRKTLLLHLNPELFGELLSKDIDRLIKRSRRLDYSPALRLNGTSDTNWFKRYPELMKSALDRGIKVYDYTKIPKHIHTADPRYHLTLSYSEADPRYERMIREFIAHNTSVNVAVVFRSENFPDMFLGRPVINGDETDLRFLDPVGVIVGLKAKGRAKLDTSGFVIDP